MRKGIKYALSLLFCLVLYSLHPVPAFAEIWVLDTESYEDSEVPVDDVMTASDAIMLLSSYSTPYDGTISTTYTTYFSGVVEIMSSSALISITIDWYTVMI